MPIAAGWGSGLGLGKGLGAATWGGRFALMARVRAFLAASGFNFVARGLGAYCAVRTF